MNKPTHAATFLILPAFLVLMGAIALPGKTEQKGQAVSAPSRELVWPLPPDPPRIAYVKSLTGPEEARLKKPGFFIDKYFLFVLIENLKKV